MKFACLHVVVLISVAVIANADPPQQIEKIPMLEAVFHVNFGDASRQESALGNIENILKEVPEAKIEVVCHGEGIHLLEKLQSKHSAKVKSLASEGIRFVACENTMEKKSIDKSELLPVASTVASGAVEIIKKQHDGYSYFRP